MNLQAYKPWIRAKPTIICVDSSIGNITYFNADPYAFNQDKSRQWFDHLIICCQFAVNLLSICCQLVVNLLSICSLVAVGVQQLVSLSKLRLMISLLLFASSNASPSDNLMKRDTLRSNNYINSISCLICLAISYDVDAICCFNDLFADSFFN